jgi:hypothetical protein
MAIFDKVSQFTTFQKPFSIVSLYLSTFISPRCPVVPYSHVASMPGPASVYNYLQVSLLSHKPLTSLHFHFHTILPSPSSRTWLSNVESLTSGSESGFSCKAGRPRSPSGKDLAGTETDARAGDRGDGWAGVCLRRICRGDSGRLSGSGHLEKWRDFCVLGQSIKRLVLQPSGLHVRPISSLANHTA